MASSVVFSTIAGNKNSFFCSSVQCSSMRWTTRHANGCDESFRTVSASLTIIFTKILQIARSGEFKYELLCHVIPVLVATQVFEFTFERFKE